MITRISRKYLVDIYYFFKRIDDKYKDFYITSNNQRIFLNDLRQIEKLLNKQEFYGSNAGNQINGILLVQKEKGFRTYVRILSENYKTTKDLLRFLIYNFYNLDLYVKIKLDNPLAKIYQTYGFTFIGNRGTYDNVGGEIFLFRQGEKIKKIIGDKENE